MTVTRDDIRRKALGMVGITWHHQGRSREGVDCIGLVYLVAQELDMLPPGLVVPVYRRDPTGEMRGYLDKHLTRIPNKDAGIGSVLLCSFMGTPFHAAIMIDPNTGTIVHGYARYRKVVVDTFKGSKDGMRLHAAYDFPGVING